MGSVYRTCACSDEICRRDGCRLVRNEHIHQRVSGTQLKVHHIVDDAKFLRLFGGEIEVDGAKTLRNIVVRPVRNGFEWLGDKIRIGRTLSRMWPFGKG